MRITKIEELGFMKYEVTIEPSRIEKFFGFKIRKKILKQTWRDYVFGSGAVYIDSEGEELGNGNAIGNAIDKYRRKKQF